MKISLLKIFVVREASDFIVDKRKDEMNQMQGFGWDLSKTLKYFTCIE